MNWWLIPYILFNALLIVWVIRMIIRMHRFLIVKEKGYLPYVRTSGRAARRVLQQGILQDSIRIVDLGCGTGVFLQAVQSIYPDAELVGVEHSWVLVQLARIRFGMRRIFGHKNVQIVRGDMFSYSVVDYDAVIGFWVTDLMPQLLEKFEKETGQHVQILSHIFTFPDTDRFTEQQVGDSKRQFFLYTRT